MVRKWGIILLLGLCQGILIPAELQAKGDGVCGGRPLPRDKDRKWRNHYLSCSGDSSSFLRESVTLPEADRKKWMNLAQKARVLRDREDRRAMQALGQKLPPVEWSGTLVYETTEHWEWTAWEYGQDPVCGCDKKEICHTETDKDGKKVEVCETVCIDRFCYHDVDYRESRHCSTESLPFDANYRRPPVTEWGPDVPGITYYDELPNKYDLLPGEAEVAQVFNGSGTTMRPYAAVGDPWNEYRFQVTPQSMACVFGGGGYHLNVTIDTVGRVKKRSPNPFREPINRFKKPMEPIEWTINHGMPVRLLFSDASAVIIGSLANNSRSFGREAEMARAEAEESRRVQGNDEASVKQKNEEGFDKDTRFRLRMIKILPRLQRDVRVTENLYGRGAEFGLGAKTEHYEVDLQSFYHASAPWGEKFWQQFVSGHVEPGYSYEFRISMYQKGVPFYYQEEDFTIGGENNWYSKELPFSFEVPKDAVDMRNGPQKLAEYYQKPWYQKTPDKFIRAWWGVFFE